MSTGTARTTRIAIRFEAEVQPRPGQAPEAAAEEMAAFVVEQLTGPDQLQDDYGALREELDEYFAADPERREEMVSFDDSGMPKGGYEGPWLVTESCTASRLPVPEASPAMSPEELVEAVFDRWKAGPLKGWEEHVYSPSDDQFAQMAAEAVLMDRQQRGVIRIVPTEAQWAALNELTSPGTAFVANQVDEQGEPTGELWLERTIDDHQVRLYSIAADGSFTYEELEGLGHGWRQFDEHGEEIGSGDE